MSDSPQWHGTTILSLRKGNRLLFGDDAVSDGLVEVGARQHSRLSTITLLLV
jgi:hypothetical protein